MTCINKSYSGKLQSRESYLDLLRVVACVLVVLSHCVPPAQTHRSWVHGFISLITSPSSETFLAISGAVLLPVRRPLGDFLKSRLTRVCPPLLIWSTIILITQLWVGVISSADFWHSLALVPIKLVLGPYWFFYVITGLYMYVSVISPWLERDDGRQVRYFLVVWLLAFLVNTVAIFTGSTLIPIEGSHFYLLNNFSGYLGYMILGYYLRFHLPPGRTIVRNILVPAAILACVGLVAVGVYFFRLGPAELFISGFTIPTPLMVYAIFMLIKDIDVSGAIASPFIKEIAASSFGIYLVHFFFRTPIAELFVYWRIGECNPLILVPLAFTLNMAMSYFLVRLLRYLPFSKYIVG